MTTASFNFATPLPEVANNLSEVKPGVLYQDAYGRVVHAVTKTMHVIYEDGEVLGTILNNSLPTGRFPYTRLPKGFQIINTQAE